MISLHRLSVLAIFAFLVANAVADDQPAESGWMPAGNSDQMAPQQPADPSMQGGAAPPNSPEAIPGWATTAMMAIDPKYSNGIVLVTGKGGTPEPRQWEIIARDSNEMGTMHRIIVEKDQVIADNVSLNAYEAFRQSVSITVTDVQTDSGDAFLTAQSYAAANDKIIDHVDYSLTINGKDSTPIWTLNCFDMNGGFLGKVEMLSTTGSVTASPGFKIAPANSGN